MPFAVRETDKRPSDQLSSSLREHEIERKGDLKKKGLGGVYPEEKWTFWFEGCLIVFLACLGKSPLNDRLDPLEKRRLAPSCYSGVS